MRASLLQVDGAPSLARVPCDVAQLICLFAGDHRTCGAVASTCRDLFVASMDERVWKQVAANELPENEHTRVLETHRQLFRDARNQALGQFRAWQRSQGTPHLVAQRPEDDPNFFLTGIDDIDTNVLLPNYFRYAVRRYAQRSHLQALRNFFDTALACAREEDILRVVKGRESDLRCFVNRTREISFSTGCVGPHGAGVLAVSLQMCTMRPCLLQSIDMSDQLMRDQGLQKVLAAILGAEGILSSLERLVLRGNKLTDTSAPWVGHFLGDCVSRSAALRYLDLSGNASLSEALLVEIALALERQLFGESPVSDTAYRRTWNDPGRLRAIASCAALETLILDRTHIGRVRSDNAKKPPDAWKHNSAGGERAAAVLLQTFLLLRHSRSETRGARCDPRRGTGRAVQTLSVSLRDCGFGRESVACMAQALCRQVCVAESVDAPAEMEADAATQPALQGPLIVKLNESDNDSGSDASASSSIRFSPNSARWGTDILPAIEAELRSSSVARGSCPSISLDATENQVHIGTQVQCCIHFSCSSGMVSHSSSSTKSDGGCAVM